MSVWIDYDIQMYADCVCQLAYYEFFKKNCT